MLSTTCLCHMESTASTKDKDLRVGIDEPWLDVS
jgi:hypothetical protein